MTAPFPEGPYDLNASQYSILEWIEIPDPADSTRRFRVNMTFLLSNYNCTFGAGCPGIKPQIENGRHDAGCCVQGAGYHGPEDVANVAKWFKKLTFKDMPEDKLRHAREHGWSVSNASGEPYKTRKLNGACIFANEKSDDPDAPPSGCAFHHLANRLGVSHVEVKPTTCWQVPLLVGEYGGETSAQPDHDLITITAQGRGEWGGVYPDDYSDLDQVTDGRYLGWWCTDTPDAYNGKQKAYVYFETELRKIMGDPAYEQLARVAVAYGKRRSQMPGERVNGGAPTVATVQSLVASLKAKQKA
ncbi:hypothetical protein BH789_gp101 [Gordonia phage GMA6]|uniref:Uncharacterized protein n=1 Tax=Gordonia phage GMA6 TaxID=1647285 RepID=A0A0K0NLF2_9CAUD|nr:hypothetical protein BH789_gp101 [Gordonia phage GMA6]AKL88382.1 hypothetical protein GMA6_101 [Gordonia phage GMA6]